MKGGHPVAYRLSSKWHRARFRPLRIAFGDCGANTLYLLGFVNRSNAIYLGKTIGMGSLQPTAVLELLNAAYPSIHHVNHYFYEQGNTIDDTWQNITNYFSGVPINTAYIGFFLNDRENNFGHFFCILKNKSGLIVIDSQDSKIEDLYEYVTSN
jgi:hypothetical protein